MEYSKHYWRGDVEAQWKKADCMMNIRKVNIDDDGMISIIQKDTQGVSGYQGYDTIDADSPYGMHLKTYYNVTANPPERLPRRKRRRLERRKSTMPNE